MSQSNLKKYYGIACKAFTRHPPTTFTQAMTPLRIEFVERGNFTVCKFCVKWHGGWHHGAFCYAPPPVTGYGFAHRMKGDKQNNEIGRAISLSRAVRDALALTPAFNKEEA